MDRWVCPRCDREFALANQAHTCVPGVAVDVSFAGRPPEFRAIYDALLRHLHRLGPVHEDGVNVGVFLKRRSKFAEVRPMARALSLDLVLPERVDSARVVRHLPIAAGRVVHVIRLVSVDQVDDELTGWLTTAYLAAGS